jgi:hypothetical protein
MGAIICELASRDVQVARVRCRPIGSRRQSRSRIAFWQVSAGGKDLRPHLDDKSVDAVFIATPIIGTQRRFWHLMLASMYVESRVATISARPPDVDAVRRSGKQLQVGTQSRSGQ